MVKQAVFIGDICKENDFVFLDSSSLSFRILNDNEKAVIFGTSHYFKHLIKLFDKYPNLYLPESIFNEFAKGSKKAKKYGFVKNTGLKEVFPFFIQRLKESVFDFKEDDDLSFKLDMLKTFLTYYENGNYGLSKADQDVLGHSIISAKDLGKTALITNDKAIFESYLSSFLPFVSAKKYNMSRQVKTFLKQFSSLESRVSIFSNVFTRFRGVKPYTVVF